MRVLDNYRQADTSKYGKVVDIITHKSDLRHCNTPFPGEALQHGTLIPDILYATDLQLSSPGRHDRIGLCGDNDSFNPETSKLLQTDTITTKAAYRLGTILKHIHHVIGEYTVKIKCNEANTANNLFHCEYPG